ncbi:MAG: hypothetical protein ABI564_01180 [Ideonella sp.]
MLQPEPSREPGGSLASSAVPALPVDRAPCTATLAVARLLIHASQDTGKQSGRVGAFLRRWRAWARQVTRSGPPAQQVVLQIADLWGRPFFSANELQPLIEVLLPAGTYHVTVKRGTQQRRYTVALENGVTFNLQLLGVPVARPIAS